MYTEDDTFSRLKRSTFETVRADLSSYKINGSPQSADDILAKHGWNYVEYITELCKRYV